MANAEIGIIGGTGVYDASIMDGREEVLVETPFGKPSCSITVGTVAGRRVAFLPRHGRKHEYPPHSVPYRANIWAMKQLGVSRIIAPSAVGSLNESMVPGSIVLPDQFVDFSKGREYSFFDSEAVHVSVADPFCGELAAVAAESARSLGIGIRRGGTYVSVEGPRFSTRAESRFFKEAVKGDVIGMTLVPEVVLAREAEICYLTIATVTDYDVWKDDPVSADMVAGTMRKSSEQARNLIGAMVRDLPVERNCACKDALKGARL